MKGGADGVIRWNQYHSKGMVIPYLNDINLNNTFLQKADLHDTNLNNADLKDADLEGANLSSASLCGVDLKGTNLRGALPNYHTIHDLIERAERSGRSHLVNYEELQKLRGMGRRQMGIGGTTYHITLQRHFLSKHPFGFCLHHTQCFICCVCRCTGRPD